MYAVRSLLQAHQGEAGAEARGRRPGAKQSAGTAAGSGSEHGTRRRVSCVPADGRAAEPALTGILAGTGGTVFSTFPNRRPRS